MDSIAKTVISVLVGVLDKVGAYKVALNVSKRPDSVAQVACGLCSPRLVRISMVDSVERRLVEMLHEGIHMESRCRLALKVISKLSVGDCNLHA